jgi:putative Ca2+/H+ antiporter (TMEM165/GDT1 family)
MSFHSIITILTPFLASLAFVTLNEMGDKTQLLAMAMATRIRFWKVMAGVLIATLLNHGLAVAVGSMLASVPGWEGWVKFAAALLFIIFGLRALGSDKPDDGVATKNRCGDVATVAFAFFIMNMEHKWRLFFVCFVRWLFENIFSVFTPNLINFHSFSKPCLRCNYVCNHFSI